MICVGCACTEDHACLVDGKPCAWVQLDIPFCTACFDRAAKQLVEGVKVRIVFGQYKGRLGVITHIPKLFPERRVVRRYGCAGLGEQHHASNLKLEK